MIVLLFIVGVSKVMLDNASLSDRSKARFEQYVRDLEIVGSELKAKGSPLSAIVDRVELIALQEFDTFCRAAREINYRL
jgi:hypothetical protein